MDENRPVDERYVPGPTVWCDAETATVDDILSVIAMRRSEANSRERSAIQTTASAPPVAVPVAGALPARLVVRRAPHKKRDREPPPVIAAMPVETSPLFPGAADSEDPFGL